MFGRKKQQRQEEPAETQAEPQKESRRARKRREKEEEKKKGIESLSILDDDRVIKELPKAVWLVIWKPYNGILLHTSSSPLYAYNLQRLMNRFDFKIV